MIRSSRPALAAQHVQRYHGLYEALSEKATNTKMSGLKVDLCGEPCRNGQANEPRRHENKNSIQIDFINLGHNFQRITGLTASIFKPSIIWEKVS